MPNRTFIPAFKARVGDWDYYICLMKYAEVRRGVEFAYALGGNKDLATMIQRGISERTKDITAYLINSPHRFLGSLIVAVWGGEPVYQAVQIADPDDLLKGIDSDFGLLTFDGSQRYFALDGQHRLKAITEALNIKPELGNEEICVLMVSHYDTEGGKERTRRLFTNINRNAKTTTPAENIALDEDDAISILTRRFLTEHPLLSQDGVVRIFTKTESETGILKLATNQIPKTHPRALTTITVLHDLLGKLSFDVPEEISDPSKRPTNEIIETAYEDLCRKIDDLLQACGNIRERIESAANARDVRAPKNAESTGHAFMRPAIQKAIAFCLRQVVFEGAGNRISWDDAKGRLQTMNWEIGKPPWTAVFNVDNARMQTSKEFSELLRELLRVHLAPSSKQEIKRARKHYRELRKVQYPVSEDKLAERLPEQETAEH